MPVSPLTFAGQLPIAPASSQATDSRWDGFANMLTEQMSETNRMQLEAADLTQKAALGNAGVSLHDAQIASSQADLSLRMMVQVRNRAVEAYKEIMNMPV